MIQLTPEDTVVLLASRPLLETEEKSRLADLLHQSIDWSFVLWRAESFQTLPLLRAHIAASEAASAIPGHILAYIDNWSAVSAARSVEQFRALGEIVTLLEHEGVDFHLLKGAAIAGLLYPDPMTRPMQDLDIMIQPHDARRVQRLMYARGYRHGVFVPDTGRFHHLYRRITKASLARNHALHSMTRVVSITPPVPAAVVLPEWRRRQVKCAFDLDGTLAMPVFVDFHVNLAAGMDLIDVWRGVASRDLLGRRVNVQSITTMLWFSAMRVYREAFEFNTLKMQMIGDVDALLRIYGDAIDWAELLAIAHKYALEPPLFYVLSLVGRFKGAIIPEPVLAMLAPTRRAKPAAVDFGDILPKLLSRPVLNHFALA